MMVSPEQICRSYEPDWPARNRLTRWQYRRDRLGRWVRANPGWCLLVVFCVGIVVMLAGVWREL